MVRMLAPMKRPIWPPISPGETNEKSQIILYRRAEDTHWTVFYFHCGQKGDKSKSVQMFAKMLLKCHIWLKWPFPPIITMQTLLYGSLVSCGLMQTIYSQEDTRLTQKTRQFIGFLLLNGFIVERLEVDIQNQNVIAVNREKHGLKTHNHVSFICFVSVFLGGEDPGWVCFFNRADVSSSADNCLYQQISPPGGSGHWGKQGKWRPLSDFILSRLTSWLRQKEK